MPAHYDSRYARRIPWLPITTAILVACSVDTSGITFQKDDVFDRYDDLGEGGDGVINIGGVVGVAGVLNKAGNGAKAGSSTGGAPNGGNATGGVPSVAGAPQGGMGGMGGMAPATRYPCPGYVKPDKLIADFSSVKTPMDQWKDATLQATYGMYAYPPNNSPIIKLGDGALTIEGQKVDQPKGVGIWVDPCIDGMAAGFTQLSFKVFGTRNDGQAVLLRVGVVVNDNKIADPMYRQGGCLPTNGDPGSCRPAVTEVMVTNSAPPGQLVTLPFSQMKDGSPKPSVDAKQIAGVEWGFIYLNGQPAYDVSVVIDDVMFQ